MKLSVISFTASGAKTAEMIKEALDGRHEIGLTDRHEDKSIPLSSWTEEAFASSDGIVFVGAVGIAVRSIAPFIVSKLTDPAVVVVDDAGHYVISVLSGHVGGGNELAEDIARGIGAVPVITTATDVHEKFAIDVWAVKQGLVIKDKTRIKTVSSKVLDDKQIMLKSDFDITGDPPGGVAVTDGEICDVRITLSAKENPDALKLVPKCIHVGIGARKDIGYEAVSTFLKESLDKLDIDPLAVACISSIDLKKDETALIAVAGDYSVPFVTYDADELMSVEGEFKTSDFVRSVTGVDNVCERSAVLSSGCGSVLMHKKSKNGVTVAVAMEDVNIRF